MVSAGLRVGREGEHPIDVMEDMLAQLTSTVTVIPTPQACDPLSLAFVPAALTLASGAIASFDLAITALESPYEPLVCSVEMKNENGLVLFTQLISAQPDDTPPEITLLGADPVTVEVGDAYVDDGTTASDNFDGDITGTMVTDNPVNVNVPGSYVVTYNVIDAAENAATEVTRTVNVITAGEAAENLSDTVADAELPNGVEQGLTAPLEQASAILSDDNPKNDVAACGSLNALLKKIDLNKKKGDLTQAEADQLRQGVQTIRASLGCK